MNGKLVYWLLSATLSVVMVLGSYALYGLSTKVESLDSRLSKHGERLATVEATNAAMQRQLDRIERKLDYLLERK